MSKELQVHYRADLLARDVGRVAFRQPPVLLKPGDVYEVEVEGLSTLSNTFVAPTE